MVQTIQSRLDLQGEIMNKDINLLAHQEDQSLIEKKRLKRKWQLLAMSRIDKNHYIPFYEQYVDYGSFDRRQKIRPIVIKRIQDILSFANK